MIYVSIGNLFANRTIPEDSSSDEEGDKEDNIDEDNNKDSNDNRDENSDKDSNESSSDSDNEGEKSKGCQVMKSQNLLGVKVTMFANVTLRVQIVVPMNFLATLICCRYV